MPWDNANPLAEEIIALKPCEKAQAAKDVAAMQRKEVRKPVFSTGFPFEVEDFQTRLRPFWPRLFILL